MRWNKKIILNCMCVYSCSMVIQATETISNKTCWTCATIGPLLFHTSRSISPTHPLLLTRWFAVNLNYHEHIHNFSVECCKYVSMFSKYIFVGIGPRAGIPLLGTTFITLGTWCRYWIPCHCILYDVLTQEPKVKCMTYANHKAVTVESSYMNIALLAKLLCGDIQTNPTV